MVMLLQRLCWYGKQFKHRLFDLAHTQNLHAPELLQPQHLGIALRLLALAEVADDGASWRSSKDKRRRVSSVKDVRRRTKAAGSLYPRLKTFTVEL